VLHQVGLQQVTQELQQGPALTLGPTHDHLAVRDETVVLLQVGYHFLDQEAHPLHDGLADVHLRVRVVQTPHAAVHILLGGGGHALESRNELEVVG